VKGLAGTQRSGRTLRTQFNDSNSTNVGAIAGGVVGGVVGAAIIAALVFFVLRKRRKSQSQGSYSYQPQDTATFSPHVVEADGENYSREMDAIRPAAELPVRKEPIEAPSEVPSAIHELAGYR